MQKAFGRVANSVQFTVCREENVTKVPIETKRNRLDLILKDLSWSI